MVDLAAPNPGNYTFGAHTLTVAGVDLGNLVNANVSVEVEELQHFSARSGDEVEDANIIRRMTFSIEATLDEPNKTNMFRFFMAGTGGEVGMAATAPVAVAFAGIPIAGNAFSWAIPRAIVRPNGNFGYNSDGWTEFALIIRVLYNTATPLAPYGTITHTGV